jgi:hypothetical protein
MGTADAIELTRPSRVAQKSNNTSHESCSYFTCLANARRGPNRAAGHSCGDRSVSVGACRRRAKTGQLRRVGCHRESHDQGAEAKVQSAIRQEKLNGDGKFVWVKHRAVAKATALFLHCLLRGGREVWNGTGGKEPGRSGPGWESDQENGKVVYRTTRALPPFMSFSTSFCVAIEVSPGVVEAKAPCAAP